MDFIKNLENLIKEKGITRTKLAKDIGISEGTIRSWLEGKMPSIDKVIKISQYFTVDINMLLGIERQDLTTNEKELLKNFRQLPEREQIKFIARVEDAAALYSNTKSSESKIG